MFPLIPMFIKCISSSPVSMICRVFDALFHMDFLPSIPQDILIEFLQRIHSKENTLPVDLSGIEEILKNYVPLAKRIGEESTFSSTITKCILLLALLASTLISYENNHVVFYNMNKNSIDKATGRTVWNTIIAMKK